MITTCRVSKECYFAVYMIFLTTEYHFCCNGSRPSHSASHSCESIGLSIQHQVNVSHLTLWKIRLVSTVTMYIRNKSLDNQGSNGRIRSVWCSVHEEKLCSEDTNGKGRQPSCVDPVPFQPSSTLTHPSIWPLYSNEVMKIDSIPLSWFIQQLILKMRAERIKRWASKLHWLVR